MRCSAVILSGTKNLLFIQILQSLSLLQDDSGGVR